MIKVGLRVPGFGNSFFKDKIDPAFQPAFDLLSIPTQNHLQQIAMAIGTAKGVSIFPNAASITAAVAWELGLPLGGEFLLFLLGRGASWITMG
jgi:citrate synthase